MGESARLRLNPKLTPRLILTMVIMGITVVDGAVTTGMDGLATTVITAEDGGSARQRANLRPTLKPLPKPNLRLILTVVITVTTAADGAATTVTEGDIEDMDTDTMVKSKPAEAQMPSMPTNCSKIK